MPSFKLKPEHIKIMTDLNFRISILIDSKDRYRPAIDVKRPFGNSGPTTNVCEIMGWHCDEESGEYAADDIERALPGLRPGKEEVLLINGLEQLMEGSITNVAIRRKKVLQ